MNQTILMFNYANFGMRMDIVKVRKVDALGNYYVGGAVDAPTGNNADTTSTNSLSKRNGQHPFGGNATKALKVIAVFTNRSKRC